MRRSTFLWLVELALGFGAALIVFGLLIRWGVL